MIETYIIVPIVSGVFGVVIGWLFPIIVKAIKKQKEKKLDSKVQELSISGEWTSVFLEETALLNETVVIEQFGRKITASIKLENRTYELIGEFKNQILVATYLSKNRRKDERGTIVLRLINENLLSGYCTFVYRNKQVYNSPYVLVSNSVHRPDKGTYHFCNSCVGKFDCCCNCESIDMPILLPFEVNNISIKYRKRAEDFATKLTTNLYQMNRINKDEGKGCTFFHDNKCSVYKDRPIDCRLFPFDFKQINGEYWVVYYDQVCSAIPTDPDEIKMCAHSMRPLIELMEPYLSESTDSVFCKRLSSQHFTKLFPIRKIRDDKIDM